MRSGIGYDVHRFGDAAALVLGGVELQGERVSWVIRTPTWSRTR